MNRRRLHLTFAVVALLAAPSFAGAQHTSPAPRAVYAMSNLPASAANPAGNEVVVYDRARDGRLVLDSRVPTGGQGDARGLGSQGALVLDGAGRHLYVVNPGSPPAGDPA